MEDSAGKEDKHTLKRTDRSVLDYLEKIARDSGTSYCKASIPMIAGACNISERQVQISTKRLMKAGLLEREGYDFSNRDLSKRGTIYKVLGIRNEHYQKLFSAGNKRSIKLLIVWSEDWQ